MSLPYLPLCEPANVPSLWPREDKRQFIDATEPSYILAMEEELQRRRKCIRQTHALPPLGFRGIGIHGTPRQMEDDSDELTIDQTRRGDRIRGTFERLGPPESGDEMDTEEEDNPTQNGIPTQRVREDDDMEVDEDDDIEDDDDEEDDEDDDDDDNLAAYL